jgi:RNA polymerase sigma-70 factor (ECF subfamily)
VDEVQPISDWLSEKPDSRLLTEELKKEIDDAIDGLPSQCKLIFQLVRIDGFKYKEVAEILNISVKTVENQVGIAIKKLAKKLHHLQDNKTPIPKKKEIKT